MCCSAWPAVFSRTITGTWEVLVDGRVNHVLWYQNQVGGGSGAGTPVFDAIVNVAIKTPGWIGATAGPRQVNNISVRSVVKEVERRTGKLFPHPVEPELITGEGNCLIIPLMGTWESIRLMNTSKTENLLKDISKALVPPPARKLPQAATAGPGSYGSAGGIIFMQFDIYDIVMAERAEDIAKVLPQIQEEKRPKVNPEVFDFFSKWYGCPVALCCFNTLDTGTAKPLGFAFEPLYPDKLIVYTLDAHDGKAPEPASFVQVDHDIFVGSYLMQADKYANVVYRDPISADLSPYILQDVLGVSINQKMENGDITFWAEDVRNGVFSGFRTVPPLSPANAVRVGHRVTREADYAKPLAGYS